MKFGFKSGILAGAFAIALLPTASFSTGDHAGGHDDTHAMPIETMREMHKSHEHAHDFAVIEQMSPDNRDRLHHYMQSVGLAMPPMDPHRGRELFLEKGCVSCHAVNGVGGKIGPSLDAADMPSPMNAFEFAARMWRAAPAMAMMQEEELGGFIDLTGEELADLIAFAHDAQEQGELSLDQVPERYLEVMAR